MNILYLTDQVFLHGGVEKVLSQKANYLADVAGDEVYIVTYRQQNKKPVYRFSDKVKFVDLGIDYEIGKSYFHPHNLRKMPRHYLRLQNVLKKIQPQIVISCNFGPDFYFLSMLEKHIPKLKEYHSSRFFTGNEKPTLMAKFTRFTEQKYDGLVILNDSERPFYDHRNISVIPNPAEHTSIRADVNAKKIMAAGRISPVKNFGDLIEAFSRVAPEFPEWELHFFGEDYLGTQDRLQKKIDRAGLQHQIKFKGVVENLQDEMRHYSIYALTSESECFPMVLLEALSVGLPVISYDSPTGPQHILRNGEDSILVPYKNLDIFTEKLKHLMQNEYLRQKMGAKGLVNVHRFNIETVKQVWINLFKSLII